MISKNSNYQSLSENSLMNSGYIAESLKLVLPQSYSASTKGAFLG